MKIGVIGTINRDTVKFPDGTIRTGWGGMLYNLRAFSRLMGQKAAIVPICNIGANCYRPIMEMLQSLPGVDCRYVKKVNERNNHCYLTYNDRDEKSEILKGAVRRLKFGDIRPLLKCDIILLNYISGNDIYLSSIKKLRKEYEGHLYVDIHSLTLGKRKNGARFFRTPPGWEQIVVAADYIQMNRRELAVLLNEKNGKTFREDIEKKIIRLCRTLEKQGILLRNKTFIMTRGAHGCMLAWYYKGNLKCEYVEPLVVIDNGDTTGCGDSFSAGFIAGLLNNKDLTECARIANRAGLDCIKENSDYV